MDLPYKHIRLIRRHTLSDNQQSHAIWFCLYCWISFACCMQFIIEFCFWRKFECHVDIFASFAIHIFRLPLTIRIFRQLFDALCVKLTEKRFIFIILNIDLVYWCHQYWRIPMVLCVCICSRRVQVIYVFCILTFESDGCNYFVEHIE